MSNIATYQVPKEAFSLDAGKTKVYTKTSDFGRVSLAQADRNTVLQRRFAYTTKDINSHFCRTCGTTLYRTGGFPGVVEMVGIRAGVLDDQSILDEPPMMEVYVERRPKWMKEIDGATQLSGTYEVLEAGTVKAEQVEEAKAK